MKTSLCLLLLLGVSGLLTLDLSAASPVSLDISPNLQQFFTGDSSVSLRCVEDGQTAEGWTVKRNRGGAAEDCGANGSDPTCLLDLSASPGGGFWCQTSSGQRSDHVDITVLDKGLILEIPAVPVKAGRDVTLRCRRSNGDIIAAFFFMDGQRRGSGPELALREVQRSDEGSYWCSTDRFGKSPPSFLRVRDPPLPHTITAAPLPLVSVKTDAAGPSPPAAPPPPSSPPPPLPQSISVQQYLCHLLVICLYCVCSVLMVQMCCRRSSGNQPAASMETRQLDEVTMEHGC
ncbi:uncharacterized protein V3H82_013724 [Fundulus diaphanus]